MEYQKYQNKTDNLHDYENNRGDHNNENKTNNLDDNTNKNHYKKNIIKITRIMLIEMKMYVIIVLITTTAVMKK